MPSSSPFLEFARNYLPSPPARILDVGCGQGELTTALAVEGYEMLGIDPLAPQGDLFRRIRLEDLEDDAGGFDAVVAVRSLHPIRDLSHGLDRVAALLRPGAPLVVDEIGWNLMDEPTLYGQQRALAAAGHGDAPDSLDELREDCESTHLGIHGYDALRRELESRFEERAFVRTPFLYRLLAGVATEVLEQALIDAGAIQPLGFRWVGIARPR